MKGRHRDNWPVIYLSIYLSFVAFLWYIYLFEILTFLSFWVEWRGAKHFAFFKLAFAVKNKRLLRVLERAAVISYAELEVWGCSSASNGGSKGG